MRVILLLWLVILNVKTAYSQTTPLKAADISKIYPEIDGSLKKLKGKDLTEKLLLAPYDGSALLLALSKTSPGFMAGTTADELIVALSNLRVNSFNQLLPEILGPLNHPGNRNIRIQTPLGMLQWPYQEQPLAVGSTFVYSTAIMAYTLPFRTGLTKALYGQLADVGLVTGGVNEYEWVAEGKTANVREEIMFAIETRFIKFRSIKRETVEHNNDPTAAGRYIVERGYIGPDAGNSNVTMMNPRRLQPTNTHRVTVETIQEAKVERCPDENGIIKGETLSSITIRITAAATGTGSPLFTEVTSQGTTTGQVNEAAELTGYDWKVNSQARNESLNTGQNFKISENMLMRDMDANGPGAPTYTIDEPLVSGEGNGEDAQKLYKLLSNSSIVMYGQLLDVYENAEKQWRSGACVELVVGSGQEPRNLKPGEPRRIAIESRHSYQAPPISVPVTGTAAGGTLTPLKPVQTPSASFMFTPDGNGKGGGAVKFTSVSQRGIAKEVFIDFTGSGSAFKVIVNYQKTSDGETLMKGKDEFMSITLANEKWQSTVFANTTFFYYGKPGEKEVHIDREQINSKVLFKALEGYSEFELVKKSPEMEVIGSKHKEGQDVSEKMFSSMLMVPNVSFSFKDNEVQDFVIDFDFPDDGEGRTPVGGGVLLIRGDQDENDVVFSKKKIIDPNSPYRTEHRIVFKKKTSVKNDYGYSNETEFAEITILSPF